MTGKKLKKLVGLSYLDVPFFLHFVPPPPSLFFKVDLAGLLCEKVKQYPVLYNKQMKGYREQDVVSNVWNAGARGLEFIENGKSHLILFFML